jgi:hypothetical protein
MKAFCATNLEDGKPNPIFSAIIATLELIGDPWVKVGSADEAEVVFVISDRTVLNSIYSPEKVFAYFENRSPGKADLPENVILLGMSLHENMEALSKVRNQVEEMKKKVLVKTPATSSSIEIPADLAVTKNSYRVLVIDDRQDNLNLAKSLLGKHQVTMAVGFADGMKALSEDQFDVVLSDMHMPDNKHYGAFNMEHSKVGGTNAWGFFSVFEVTAKGLPLAIVTDGNHHSDWVSAGFDHLKGATVNGQVVMFFNSIGKRWDQALFALEEVNAFMPNY